MWGSKGEKKRGREKNMGYKNTGTQKQGLKKKKKNLYISTRFWGGGATHARTRTLGCTFFWKTNVQRKELLKSTSAHTSLNSKKKKCIEVYFLEKKKRQWQACEAAMHTYKKEKRSTLFFCSFSSKQRSEKQTKKKKRENSKKELEKALLSFQIMATRRALYKKRSADG